MRSRSFVRPTSLLVAFAVALGLALAASPVAAQELHWPPAAEKRFKEALQLSLHGKHLDAAEVYKSVAEWPEGGEWKERARALYSVASELQLAHQLEPAVETYREVARRYPKSDFAGIATRAADAIAPPGVSGGLDFERRFQEMIEVLGPASTLYDRKEADAARPGLEKSRGLLESLLRDHEDHPRAVDVAINLSDVLIKLHRFDEARAASVKAIAVSEREAAKPGSPDAARANLANARLQYVAVARAVRLLWIADWGAKALLVVLGVALASRRPWKRVTPRLLRLGIALVVLDVVLAGAGVVGAEYVRRTEDPDSLLSDPMAAALVLVPGTIGIVLALGFATSVPGRRGALLAMGCSVLGALAAALTLVHDFGFYRLIPLL